MQPYDLDSGISEYFEFILKGNTYRFRYPTTRESFEAKKLTGVSDEESKAFMVKFVSKVDEKTPDFADIIEDLNVKYWAKFIDMVTKELSNVDTDTKNS